MGRRDEVDGLKEREMGDGRGEGRREDEGKIRSPRRNRQALIQD